MIPKSFLVLLSTFVAVGCEAPSTPIEEGKLEAQEAGAHVPQPEDYRIDMTAKSISDTQVEFVVTTNAPLPIEAMADVTLEGQLDHETWIGEQKRVTLDKPKTVFVLDTASNGKNLPTGKYMAEISFHSRWGADDNVAAKNVPDMSATQEVALNGSGESSEHARNKARMQRWVLGEMDLSRTWSDDELESKLGRFEQYESPKAVRSLVYYFPDADVSLFVDPVRGKVFTYELGRAL